MSDAADNSTPDAGGPVCPYCAHALGESASAGRCPACRGRLDPLSRQATQNAMGPWFVADASRPFGPPCSLETLRSLIERGKVRAATPVRGPTTRQFWRRASETPGVAVLLGVCHQCGRSVRTDEYLCVGCHAVLSPTVSREHLGLSPRLDVLGDGRGEGPGEGPSQRADEGRVGGDTRAAAASAIGALDRGGAELHAEPSGEPAVSVRQLRQVRQAARGTRRVAIGLLLVNLGLLGVLGYVLATAGGAGGSGGGGLSALPGTVSPQPGGARSPGAAVLGEGVRDEVEAGDAGGLGNGATVFVDPALAPMRAELEPLLAAGRSEDLAELREALRGLEALRGAAGDDASDEGELTQRLLDELIEIVRQRVERAALREAMGEGGGDRAGGRVEPGSRSP